MTTPSVPRSFMVPAYILPEGTSGVYSMYRHVEVEDPVTKQREKFGERIGPIMRLREARLGEEPDFHTVDPRTGLMIPLKRIEEETEHARVVREAFTRVKDDLKREKE